MNPDHIYVGASYRHGRETVTITEIAKGWVHYRGVSGWMVGSSDIDAFARDAVRTFPHQPTVEDVVAMMSRMAPEQVAAVWAEVGAPVTQTAAAATKR